MEKQNSTVILNPEGTSSEEVPLVGGGSFDVAESVAHELKKQRKRERHHESEKHNVPVARYNQRRQEREIANGNLYNTRKRAIEAQTSRYDAVQAELVKEPEPERLHEENMETFGGLFSFLGESTFTNPKVEAEFKAIVDTKRRLQYLLSLPLADKTRLMCSDQFGYANRDNFIRQLQFQQDFINGQALGWKQEWDGENREYVDVQYILNPEYADLDNITLGLNRASLRAAMIGTPEYGAYKMAKQIARSRHIDTKVDYPYVHGYKSRVDNYDIGDWAEIVDEYAAIAARVAKRHPGLSPEELEYKTVRDVAYIYTKSMEYQTDRGPESPYVSTFHESVAWAQLGEGVQAQLRGMRQKIMDVDLHNIERFIGKSGSSEKLASYRNESFRLGKQLEIARKGDEAADELLARENGFALSKQEKWKERELARIAHKYEKKISRSYDPERQAHYRQEQEEEVQRVIQSFNEQTAYLSSRGMDEFVGDLTSRQGLVERRVAKRKSLAEKAIDLHFKLGIGEQVWDEDDEEYHYKNGLQYQEMIDWINDAPFGTIKRAHKRMSEGMSADDVYKPAIQEIILRVVDDKDNAGTELNQMFADFESSGNYQIQPIIELACILGGYDVVLSFGELKAMARKDTQYIDESMKVFSFDDVKTFVDNDINLYRALKISRVIKEFGYELDSYGLVDFIRGTNINAYYGFEVEGILSSSLRQFSLEEVKQAMVEDVDLKVLSHLGQLRGEIKFGDLCEVSRKITFLSGGVNNGDYLSRKYIKSINKNGKSETDRQLMELARSEGSYHRVFDQLGDNVIKYIMENSRDVASLYQQWINRYDWDIEISSVRSLDNLLKDYEEKFETFVKSLVAGFRIDELRKYPFLVSKLIPSKYYGES